MCFSSVLFLGGLVGKMHRVRHVWAQVGAIFLLLSSRGRISRLKAMASNQQRKKQQRSSGSWPSLSSDESWLMVDSPFAAEHPVAEEDPFSISAVAEEDPYSEPSAASVAAVAEEDPYSEPPAASASAVAEEDPYSEPLAASVAAVAEADPYSEPFAAPAAPLAIEDATPVAAVSVAPLRMQPSQLLFRGNALAIEDVFSRCH